jgi:hypothetical protein
LARVVGQRPNGVVDGSTTDLRGTNDRPERGNGLIIPLADAVEPTVKL